MSAENARRSRTPVWYSIHYEQLAYDPVPLLQDISAPTLILRGEEDVSRGGIVGSQFMSLQVAATTTMTAWSARFRPA
jgi:hypothetical protein